MVWVGRSTGVYSSWEHCKVQIEGFENARYMGFPNEAEARKAYAGTWQQAYANKNKASTGSSHPSIPKPSGDIIAVDAACSGNPGKMEYRGVYLRTGQTIFHNGPYEDGTNNIGEFLAIVHALALQKQKGTHLPIFSDSANALLWVRKKKCGTKLAETAKNGILFELIDRAENWLHHNDYKDIPLHKWETAIWGEIPADFGRK